jgi:hypothetical protein
MSTICLVFDLDPNAVAYIKGAVDSPGRRAARPTLLNELIQRWPVPLSGRYSRMKIFRRYNA